MCRLEPLEKFMGLEQEYDISMTTFSNSQGEDFQLYTHKVSKLRVIELVEKLFPGQTSIGQVSDALRDSLKNWIIEGKDPKDQVQLEDAAKRFLKQVEEAIRPIIVYLPIEGLEIKSSRSLQLGKCFIYSNHSNSEFMQLMNQDTNRYGRNNLPEWLNNHVKAYATFEVTAHSKRGMSRGIDETNQALNILRLYISSYYFHENGRSVVRRMGLSGTLNHGERSRIFFVSQAKPLDSQYPGGEESRTVVRNFEVTDEFIDHMYSHGLARINNLLQSVVESGDVSDIARRLHRAVTWYAKATKAKNIADSYLMYAIALEGLLSEGRTSQETYSLQVAALVSCDKDECIIYPVGGYLSSEFSKKLKKTKNLTDRFNLIRDRVFQLISYRNRIAHGAVLENEVDEIELLDFETLVQNTILAFVMKEWRSFKDFTSWFNKNIRYEFRPN